MIKSTQRNGSFKDTVNGLKNLEEIKVPISVKTIILKQTTKIFQNLLILHTILFLLHGSQFMD